MGTGWKDQLNGVLAIWMAAAMAVSVVPLANAPDPSPLATYTGFPSLDPDDGKFMAVAGEGLSTLAGIAVVAYIGVPAGETSFEVGIFDGDTGGHWDLVQDAPVLRYRLYADPFKNGTTASQVDQWTSPSAPDDAWLTKTYSTSGIAEAPSGNYFYRLEVNWLNSASTSFNNFKIRTTGQISLRAGQEFGFAAGPQRIPSGCPGYNPNDPPWDPPVGAGDPNPGEQNDPDANSYDGDWSWYFYVPTSLTRIEFRDGDADRWNDANNPGQPADDGDTYGACAHVGPSIYYEITDPAANVYTNNNPSGDQEWEDFSIGPDPGDDVVISYELEPGLWRFRVRGMDAHNFNVLRAGYEVYSAPDPPLTVNPKPTIEPDWERTTPNNVTLEYAHTVTNRGRTDSFDLRANSSEGWTTRIYHDENGNGQVDPSESQVSRTPSLIQNQSYRIVVQLDVPPDVSNVDDITIVRASSRTEWAVQDEATDTTHVRVNRAPNADAGGPYVGPEGSPITLNAGGSSDPDDDPLTYAWDWDGDGVYDETTTDPVVAHVWGDDLVDHDVILQVSDGQLNATATAKVTVTNVAPSVAMQVVPAGNEGDTLQFVARFTDPGSDDLTYTWWGHCTGWSASRTLFLDPGGTPDPDPSPDVNPRDETVTESVVCGDDGTLEWNLQLKDDDGGETRVSGTFSVANLPPTLAVEPPSLIRIDENTLVALEATATDAGSDDLTFTWDWDFGPTESRTHFNDGVGPDPDPSPGGTFPFTATDGSSHTYGDDCTCLVRLTVEDDDGGVVTYTTTVEVVNVPPSLAADITATATFDLRLRVAGEKYHDVTLTLYPDGLAQPGIMAAQIVRMPGSPDDQSATVADVTIDALRGVFAAVVEYTPLDDPINGQVWGADPAWLILTAPDGTEVRIHHTFNVRHPKTWVWTVSDFRPYLVGFPIEFTAVAADPGSDDLTFTWSWGDGTPDTVTTYLNGPTPDPFPSPDVNPMTATDVQTHRFDVRDTFVVTLEVEDDDHGRVKVQFTLDLDP